MSKELDILAEWGVWGSLEKKRDLETILLKGHLLLEMILDMILLRNYVDDCRAFSFYRKIGLLGKLNAIDRNKLEKVVAALTQINVLRNKLAHEILFIVDNSDFSYWAIEMLVKSMNTNPVQHWNKKMSCTNSKRDTLKTLVRKIYNSSLVRNFLCTSCS